MAESQQSAVSSQQSFNSITSTQNSSLLLSVYMITYNNGRTIEKALRSIAGWAEEVIVVDSHSTDETPEIIRKYSDRFYQYDTTSQRDKYQYAQDLCKNSWVLFIDADEWLTQEIKNEIEDIVLKEARYAGFIVNRQNIYLGREIKYGGWYPDHEIRLYRKEKGQWEGGIHAKIHVDGEVGTLKNAYMHTPYMDTAHQIRTIDRYSGAYADDLHSSGRRFHLINMLARPIFRFFRDYIFKKGFLDGIPGLIIVASTMYYVFMKQAKLWEMERNSKKQAAGSKGQGVSSVS